MKILDIKMNSSKTTPNYFKSKLEKVSFKN